MKAVSSRGRLLSYARRPLPTPMMRLASPLLLLLVAGLLIGCSDDPTSPDGPPDLTDTWTASFEDESGASFQVTLDLVTTATSVSGGGTFDGPEGSSTAFTIASGSYVFPSLQLSLSPEGSRPGTLNGTVSEDGTTIDATVNGTDVGSFSETPLVLTR